MASPCPFRQLCIGMLVASCAAEKQRAMIRAIARCGQGECFRLFAEATHG